MGVVGFFLDKLVKEESSIANPINDIEIKKNEILEIKNIIMKYNGLLDENTIINMKDEDLKRLFELYDGLYSLYDECIINIKIIKTFMDFKEVYKDFEAPQYESSLEWIKGMCVKINEYINNFEKDNLEYQKYLEEKVKLPKEYLKLFKNEKLIKPIENIEDFLKFVDDMSLTLEDRIELKCEIGKMNSKLLFKDDSSTKKTDDLVYEKYFTILKNKKSKYKDIYKIVKNEKIEIETFSNDIKEISKKYKLDIEDVTGCGIAIILEKTLKNKKNRDIDYLEKILDLNVNNVDKNNKEEITEDKKILDEIKDIFDKEKRLIKKVNEDELNLFLAQSINLNDEKAIGYKIISVLSALYSEAEKFKNSAGMKFTHDNSLGNIRQFIEAYNMLKENQNKILDEKRKTVLYLTNKNDDAYIDVDSKNYNEEEKDSLYELLNYIEYENLNKIKCSEIFSDLEIYKVSNNIMKVAFIKLDYGAVLVLNANIIGNDEKNSSFVFSRDVKFIKSIIEMTKDQEKLIKLYNSQEKVRKNINEGLK